MSFKRWKKKKQKINEIVKKCIIIMFYVRKVIWMLYCFDSRLPFDYSKTEMALSKMNGNGILYDNVSKVFTDFEGNKIDISSKIILPRTGVTQIYDMNDEIVKQGGILAISNEQVTMIENWPNYYFNEREIKILKGKDLIDLNIIEQLKNIYGEEIFIKTKVKNFSGVIAIDLLLDNECAFYKALLYHLDEDFIISKNVDILLDKYGKKEYRCFIVNNEVYNISRFTTSVLHKINVKVLEKAQEIIKKLEGVFPDFYVLDLFEYRLDGKDYIDVVEFNPIHASGLYLYNSCIRKSDDVLHSNINYISREFIDKIDECTIDGCVFNNRANLYDNINSFANDLRSICVTGNIGLNWVHGIELSDNDFARHNPIHDLSITTEVMDDFIYENESNCDDLDIPKEMVEKVMQLLKITKY